MPSQLKTILAATDLSRKGNRAVERAAMLAAKSGAAELRVLHVLEQPWLAPRAAPELAQGALRRLDRLAAEMGRDHGVRVQHRLGTGSTLRVIAQDSRRSDLLVLGASTGHAVRDLLLGSPAQRLLARTPASILVARDPPRSDYGRVLVALNLSEFDDRTLAFARAVAPGARLDLVHVFDSRFEGKMRYAGVSGAAIEEYRSVSRDAAMQELRFAAERVPGHARTLVVGGPIASNVLRQGRESHADLIVVGHPPRRWLVSLLMRRVAAEVLSHARTDILVVQ
jgi:universal stress protein E